MTLGDLRLALRSSHALADSQLETAAPIGAGFEGDGSAVAAVEINAPSR
jgi:hypothetical protein